MANSYKGEGQTIVTVPLDPALHKKLRVHAAQEGRSIKWLVTHWIEAGLNEQETPQ